MSTPVKIAFIGAGSAAFGLSLYQDLFTEPDLGGSTLCLIDTDAAALARMESLARTMNAAAGTGLVIESTTERKIGLDGADFVLNAVAIDRNRLWRHDFAVPKKYGIRHTLGENGGPGGLFFTLRTMPLLFDIARDVERICPKALFLNLSNPESRLVLGLSRYTGLRALGLCHGVFLARWFICQILGMREPEVDIKAAGLNHFQWVTDLREQATGRDLYPLLKEREQNHDPSFTPLTRTLFRAFGLWPTCSDDHMGEHLAYGWEGGEHGFDFEGDEKGRVILKDLMDGVIAGTTPIPEDWKKPSWGERAVRIMAAIATNKGRLIESGVVWNQGVIPNLDPDLAVEVPLFADGAGVHPLSQGPLPDGCARLLAMPANVQHLAVEAAVRGSKELALQALLVDPVVTSTDAAKKILDELWEINRPYIRSCL